MIERPIITAVISFMLVANVFAFEPQTPSEAERLAYPDFSWDRVPVMAHLAKASGDFSDDEARFLATRFPLVCLEKTQGIRQHGNAEAGIAAAARQLKAINPRCKVLSYWNVFLAYPQYAAHEEFTTNPDWLLRDSAGKPFLIRGRVQTYDLSVSAMRQWWIGVAASAAKGDHIDGVFVDAVPKIGMIAAQNRRAWGAVKYEGVESGLWQMLQQLQATLGPSELVIFNGLRGDHQRWSDGGFRYLRVTSGAMVEHFGHFSARSPDGRLNKERMADDLALISRAGREGKIVIVKGWPGFSWMDPRRDNSTRTYAKRDLLSSFLWPAPLSRRRSTRTFATVGVTTTTMAA